MAELADLRARLSAPDTLLAQAQPLSGIVYTERGPLEVAEALVAFAVGPVVYRFGTWVVTTDGIACLVRHYPLTRAQLQGPEDWARHLAEQPWANLWDVLRALTVATHPGTRSHSGGGHGDESRPS